MARKSSMDKWIEDVVWKPVVWLIGLYLSGVVLATILGIPDRFQHVVGALFSAAGGITMLGLFFRRKLEQ